MRILYKVLMSVVYIVIGVLLIGCFFGGLGFGAVFWFMKDWKLMVISLIVSLLGFILFPLFVTFMEKLRYPRWIKTK